MNIKEDANDSIQFNLFQKNADMFFQCALISKEEDDDRKRICGFGIYEDCAAEIGVSRGIGLLSAGVLWLSMRLNIMISVQL